MSELTEFLLARIAEDESLARSASDFTGSRPEPTGGEEVWAVLHNERWTPARVLRECEAKRRIVEAMGDDWVTRRLAEVYVDHPDYKEPWGVGP